MKDSTGRLFNTVTGKYDDGTSVSPAEMRAAGNAPTLGVPVPTATSIFPAKSPHETTISSERRIAGPESIAAAEEVKTAGTGVTEAGQEDLLVKQREADVAQQAADERVAEQARRAEEARIAEDIRQRKLVEDSAADEAERIADRDLRIRASGAEANYYEGNPVAEIFHAVVRSLGTGFNQLAGNSGPSPADIAIDKRIASHKAKLVGEWEASKEANELKRKNRAAYTAELDRQEIKAANQSLTQLDVIESQMKAGLAGLGREKAAAAQTMFDKLKAEKDARLNQEIAEKRDKLSRVSDTTREDAGGVKPDAAQHTQNIKDADELKDLEAASTAAKAGLAEIDGIIDRNGGIPVVGENARLYEAAVNRAAKAVARMESGNPNAEASDPTIRALTARLGPGWKEAVLKGGAKGARENLKKEGEAIDRRVDTFAKAKGLSSPVKAPETQENELSSRSLDELKKAWKKASAAGDERASAIAKEILRKGGEVK